MMIPLKRTLALNLITDDQNLEMPKRKKNPRKVLKTTALISMKGSPYRLKRLQLEEN
jgi:hypothetical protein